MDEEAVRFTAAVAVVGSAVAGSTIASVVAAGVVERSAVIRGGIGSRILAVVTSRSPPRVSAIAVVVVVRATVARVICNQTERNRWQLSHTAVPHRITKVDRLATGKLKSSRKSEEKLTSVVVIAGDVVSLSASAGSVRFNDGS